MKQTQYKKIMTKKKLLLPYLMGKIAQPAKPSLIREIMKKQIRNSTYLVRTRKIIFSMA